MNLPDIHTQKLLDCLTHSRLGFALYRLPYSLDNQNEKAADIFSQLLKYIKKHAMETIASGDRKSVV